MSKQTISITRSDFAEKFLYLNGHPFSLQDYPHMNAVYNSLSPNIVMKFSRQTAKSSTIANIMVASAAMTPYFKMMYISPSVKQTKMFSHDRVAPVIENSPLIKQYYTNSSLVQNVFTKKFLNGSQMYLMYAGLKVDHLRGFSNDLCLFDETQDLVIDHIPVIQETMSRSMYKHNIYAGTPKRSKGTLAQIWFRSTQNEYAIKCPMCSHWNILGENNIGLHGLICEKDGTSLHPAENQGEWVSTYSLVERPTLEGFRVCALHFADAPWVNWQTDVLDKRHNSPSKALFYNETLALEHDEGVAPITKLQLQDCCDPELILSTEPDDLTKSYHGIMGIDYGPINSEKSNTVCVVIQKRGDKFVIPFIKKFKGREADYAFIHNEIPRLMRLWQCDYLAADYGMGEASNSELRSKLGQHKVIAFQHMREQKEIMKWNSKMPAYTLGRTSVMTELFGMIKKREVVFPRWDYFEPFAEDILNIQMEHDEINNKTKYVNNGPDDFFHALLYGILFLRASLQT